ALEIEESVRTELEALGFRVLDESGNTELKRPDLIVTGPQGEKIIFEIKNLASRHIGRKSEFAAIRKNTRDKPPEYRAQFAQSLQAIETTIQEWIKSAQTTALNAIEVARTARESTDVTITGRRPQPGHLHPITLMRQRIEDIFVSLGYIVEDDREIETDFYNFDALNIPEGHPARDPQDTFYTTEGFALRSQTSTVQIHAMQRR